MFVAVCPKNCEKSTAALCVGYLCRCVRDARLLRLRASTCRHRQVADDSARRSSAESECVASSSEDRIAADALQRSDRRRRRRQRRRWRWALRPTSSTAAVTVAARRRQSRKPWLRNGNGRIGDLNARPGRYFSEYAVRRFLVRSSAPLDLSRLQFVDCKSESCTVDTRRCPGGARPPPWPFATPPVGWLAIPCYSPASSLLYLVATGQAQAG